MVARDHLIAIDGYRSDFVGWGWEDVDVHLRLQRRLRLQPVYAACEVVHLEHGDETRDTSGGAKKAESSRDNFSRACESYARNDFAGTYRADVRAWESGIRRTVWTSEWARAGAPD
jgi:hypothetical protein